MDKRSKRLLKNLNNNLAFCIENTNQFLININSPLRLKVFYVIRTAEEQFELYKKGRKLKDGKWIIVNKKKVVTSKDGYNKKSKHQEFDKEGKGKAVDIVVLLNGKITWNIKYYHHIAGIILRFGYETGLNIKWGGWFSNIEDGGHFQID